MVAVLVPMFGVFARHAAPGARLMFTSGPSEGESIGSYHGEPLYHAPVLWSMEFSGVLASAHLIAEACSVARALQPDVAIFLNLSDDHLDRHGNSHARGLWHHFRECRDHG